MALDGVNYNGLLGRGQGRFFRGKGFQRPSHRERFSGPSNRGPLHLNARSSTYGVSKPSYQAKHLPWKHDLFEDSLRTAGFSGDDNGTKLYISNLNVRVSNEDIRGLFSEFGQLMRYALHYGQNGCPNGSAEVVFSRKTDAVEALKRYNNVVLEGKPMILEMPGSSLEVPIQPRDIVIRNINGRRAVTVARARNRDTFAVNRGSGFGFTEARTHDRGSFAVNRDFSQTRRWDWRNVRGHIRGRGGKVWRKKIVEKSAEELDKELENYHANAGVQSNSKHRLDGRLSVKIIKHIRNSYRL